MSIVWMAVVAGLIAFGADPLAPGRDIRNGWGLLVLGVLPLVARMRSPPSPFGNRVDVSG